MAYLRGNKKINPLDINKNVTIGIAFPLDETNLFNGTKTVKEQIKTNLINLLLTEPGERLYTPNYGIGLKGLLFESNIDQENLNSKINQQINFYIPEISLIETQVNFIEDEHKLYITISYKSNLDGSNDTIQLNFN
tara:strand:- start:2230 stop:2637 length:408 start_codon:yes stop_codon:yes gene_type:complete